MKNLKQFGEPLTKEQMKGIRGGELPCAYIFTANCPDATYVQGCGSDYPDDNCGFTPSWAQAMAAAGCDVSYIGVSCA